MTIEMMLALGVLVLMIILIMSDKLPFGAPPLIACILLVLVGLSTVQEAFAGFINPTVILIAGFIMVMAGLMKSGFVKGIQQTMFKLVEKGGFKSYAALVVVVMLGASLMGTGATGYYVLILSLITTIPYSDKLPTSKLMLPLGFATNHPLIPVNTALQYGVVVSLLGAAGYELTVNMPKFAFVNFLLSLAVLAWSLLAFKILPEHPVEAPAAEDLTKQEKTLTKFQEFSAIGAFVVSVIGMMLIEQLGGIAYITPLLAGIFLVITGVLEFDEFRNNWASPLVFMTAGVIGVADALANTGLTTLIGDQIVNVIGADMNPLILLLLLAFLTSISSTLTGSTLGSIFVFAPIAITTFISMGLNPIGAATAVVISGWNGGFMPIDGLPAMAFGMGKYKLIDFWKFTVPLYFIRIVALCVGALLIFPA